MEIGDKVVILASHPPGLSYHPIPRGTIGIITQPTWETGATVAYTVGDEDLIYSFYISELDPIKRGPFLDPEMELDEIEKAERLMIGLKV